MNNIISQTLNMTPIKVDEETQEVVRLERDEIGIEIIDDLTQSRENIKELILIGQQSVVELARLADQAQSTEAYKALSSLIKTCLDANKDIIEIHKAKQELVQETEQETDGTVVNNLFVGSTAELLSLMRKAKE